MSLLFKPLNCLEQEICSFYVTKTRTDRDMFLGQRLLRAKVRSSSRRHLATYYFNIAFICGSLLQDSSGGKTGSTKSGSGPLDFFGGSSSQSSLPNSNELGQVAGVC